MSLDAARSRREALMSKVYNGETRAAKGAARWCNVALFASATASACVAAVFADNRVPTVAAVRYQYSWTLGTAADAGECREPDACVGSCSEHRPGIADLAKAKVPAASDNSRPAVVPCWYRGVASGTCGCVALPRVSLHGWVCAVVQHPPSLTPDERPHDPYIEPWHSSPKTWDKESEFGAPWRVLCVVGQRLSHRLVCARQ